MNARSKGGCEGNLTQNHFERSPAEVATRAEWLEQSSLKRSDKKHFPHIDSDLDVTIITIVTPLCRRKTR